MKTTVIGGTADTRDCWENPQAAYFLAILAGVPAVAEGSVGVAKGAVMAAFASALKRTFVPLYGSMHAPEDFSGLPIPQHDIGYVKMMPSMWAHVCAIPGALLFIDELTTVRQSTQCPMLSMLTERRVGDVYMHSDTLIAAACNPVDLAPEATPLSRAMCNRFYHHNWQIPYEDWSAGLLNGFSWQAPSFPELPADWQNYKHKWGGLIAGFLRKSPKNRHNVPQDDSEKAFPTPRSWTNAGTALAAADAAAAPQSVKMMLATGLVGEAVAAEFFHYVAVLDLIDPDELLDGKAKYKYEPEHFDRAVALIPAMITALKQNMTGDRYDKAMEVLLGIAKTESGCDLTIPAFKPLIEMCPKGHVLPAKLTQEMFQIVSRSNPTCQI